MFLPTLKMSTREFKEGPMACPQDDTSSFLEDFHFNIEMCQEFLQEHISTFSDAPWTAQDGEGQQPTSDFEKASLKLVTELVYQNDKVIFPPPFTRLSDELVYLATKLLKASDRGEKYPYDFLPRGDINPDRVPSGVGPIVWAHGLPFFPVYKGYYILTGRAHAGWVGWLLQHKSFQQMKGWPIWTIGPVVAPGSAAALPRTITKQAHLWKLTSARNCPRGQEKNAAARDIVSKAHQDLAVVPDGEGGFVLTQIYNIPGYHVRVGPNQVNGSRADTMPRSFFSKNRITGFDYDTCANRPYQNEHNPRLYEEGGEEDDNKGDETEDQGLSDADDGKSVTHGDTTETEDPDPSQQGIEATTPQPDNMEIEQSQAIAKEDGKSEAGDDAMDTDAAQETAKEDVKIKPSAGDMMDTDDAQTITKGDEDIKLSGDAMDTDDAQATTKGEGDIQSHDATMDTRAGQANSNDEKAIGDDDTHKDEAKTEDVQLEANTKEEDSKTSGDAMETEDTSALQKKDQASQTHDDSTMTGNMVPAKEGDGVAVHDPAPISSPGHLASENISEQKVEPTESENVRSTPPTTVQGNIACQVAEPQAVKSLTPTTETIQADNGSTDDTPMTEAPIKNETQTEDAEPAVKTE